MHHGLEFYVAGYEERGALIKRLVGIIIGLLALLPCVALIAYRSPVPFGVGPDGRIYQPPPLSQPVSDEKVRQFCQESVPDVFTFGYHDYQRWWPRISPRFTNDGLRQFDAALGHRGYLKGIIEFNQVVSTVPRGPCQIVEVNKTANPPYWITSIPVIINTQSGTQARPKDTRIELRLVRVFDPDALQVLGIDQWRQVDN